MAALAQFPSPNLTDNPTRVSDHVRVFLRCYGMAMKTREAAGIDTRFWAKNGDIGNYPGADWARVRGTSKVIDDGCGKQVWAEMTDSELEDRLFTYLWISLHTSNAHASRVAQLIEEPERRGLSGMVERVRVKAQTTPIANAE